MTFMCVAKNPDVPTRGNQTTVSREPTPFPTLSSVKNNVITLPTRRIVLCTRNDNNNKKTKYAVVRGFAELSIGYPLNTIKRRPLLFVSNLVKFTTYSRVDISCPSGSRKKNVSLGFKGIFPTGSINIPLNPLA